MGTSDLADATPATGIVWAYRFRPDGAAEPIAQAKIEGALADHGGGWIWLHLALGDTRCRTWIAQQAPVSEMAREVLAGPDRHLRTGEQSPDLHQERAAGETSCACFGIAKLMMRQRPVRSRAMRAAKSSAFPRTF
jgi:hypothetical protein